MTIELSASLAAIDNVAAGAHYAGPSLVLIGDQDTVTPPPLARQVYDALPGRSKQLLLVAGADHNGVLTNQATAPAYCAFVAKLASTH